MKRDATGSLADLYRHGLIQYDEILTPKSKKYAREEAKIGENGVIWYGGKAYSSPSPAGSAVTGKSCNGWDFWHVFRDKQTGEYRPTTELGRGSLIAGLGWSEDMDEIFGRVDPSHVKMANVEMVSLDELRNKLPQGFASE